MDNVHWQYILFLHCKEVIWRLLWWVAGVQSAGLQLPLKHLRLGKELCGFG